MTTDIKSKCQKNFGQNARTYDKYAVVQKEMAAELLSKIQGTGRSFHRILEIGCGTGYLTELLSREYPQALITALDIAPEMIEVARRKLTGFPNIRYLVGDGENLPSDPTRPFFDQPFDLIASNAVLQWFTDYAPAFTRYHSLLEAGGYLIFSTLGAGTFKELHTCLENRNTGPETGSLTYGKREHFIAKARLRETLMISGFQFGAVEEVAKQQYFASGRDFLRALKRMGAHSYLSEPGLGSDVFQLIKSYEDGFQDEKGIPATYRWLFGQGRKRL